MFIVTFKSLGSDVKEARMVCVICSGPDHF